MKLFTLRNSLAALGTATALLSGSAHAQTTTPATTAVAPTPKVNRITGVAPDPKWLEEHAYTLGVQAYEYAFPWHYSALLRFAWATRGVMAGKMSTPLMTPNVFQHQRVLTDASYKDGGRPNNDTTYSGTWADVGREPLIISVPDMGKRYFSIELASFDQDNFDYIGTRATGNKAGHYAIVSADWKGQLPEGVKALAPAPTPWIFALMRVLVDGNEDLPAVHKLQDQVVITPLSQWKKPASASSLPPYKFAPPFPRKDDPLADWKTINRAMTEVPPPARDAMLVKLFAQIGVGPGQDVDKMDEATKRGLARAADMGRRIVTSAPAYNYGREFKNGWAMTPPNWGRLGQDGHFLVRTNRLASFVTNDREENIYPALLTEPNGERLNGNRRYVLRFAPGQLPPTNAFWSVTAYDSDYNFVDNAINRYSVGDRSKGLSFDADGGLTLYVQKDSPGAAKEGNWLPTGGDALDHLVMRMYLPKPEALNGTWAPPAIQRVE